MRGESIQQQKRALRTLLRARRRALTAVQAEHFSGRCQARILSEILTPTQHCIGLYLDADGEVRTQALITQLWQLGREVVVPVIDPVQMGRMCFQPYTPDSRLLKNRLGIAEPATTDTALKLTSVDLLLLPLVGFSTDGNRLGMGGGFYDRMLHHTSALQCCRYGLAYECQKVTQLPLADWDQPVDGIVTESALYRH